MLGNDGSADSASREPFAALALRMRLSLAIPPRRFCVPSESTAYVCQDHIPPFRQKRSDSQRCPRTRRPFAVRRQDPVAPVPGQRVGGLGHRLRAPRCCLCFAPGNGGSDAWCFYRRSFSVQLFARPSPRLWPHRLAQTRQLRRSWHAAKDRPCFVLGLRLCAYSRQGTHLMGFGMFINMSVHGIISAEKLLKASDGYEIIGRRKTDLKPKQTERRKQT